MQLCGCGGDGEAGFADVGDAIAVGIGSGDEGGVDEVGAEAVGGAKAGAFAQKDEGDSGFEEGADFILQRDAGVTRYDERGKGPAAGANQGQERGQQRLALGGNGVCGEAVGDDDHKVAGGGVGLDESAGFGSEAAAEVGTPEVLGAVACGGKDGKDQRGKDAQALGECLGVKG